MAERILQLAESESERNTKKELDRIISEHLHPTFTYLDHLPKAVFPHTFAYRHKMQQPKSPHDDIGIVLSDFVRPPKDTQPQIKSTIWIEKIESSKVNVKVLEYVKISDPMQSDNDNSLWYIRVLPESNSPTFDIGEHMYAGYDTSIRSITRVVYDAVPFIPVHSIDQATQNRKVIDEVKKIDAINNQPDWYRKLLERGFTDGLVAQWMPKQFVSLEDLDLRMGIFEKLSQILCNNEKMKIWVHPPPRILSVDEYAQFHSKILLPSTQEQYHFAIEETDDMVFVRHNFGNPEEPFLILTPCRNLDGTIVSYVVAKKNIWYEGLYSIEGNLEYLPFIKSLLPQTNIKTAILN